MAEMNSPQAYAPHARIQRLFELAHGAANDLTGVEPVTLSWSSYESQQPQARDRLLRFAGQVAAWRHRRHQPQADNPAGLHAVHPQAGIGGSFYHASRPNHTTFDLVTLHGFDSRGEFFAAEELVIRDNPAFYTAGRDMSLGRVSYSLIKMQPMSISLPLGTLNSIESQLIEFCEMPDTADTIRLMITSAPADADR